MDNPPLLHEHGEVQGAFQASRLWDSDRRLRDVVALSTLPAIWLNADPLRIAESLASALFTSVAPALVCVCLDKCSEQDPVVAAQVDRGETRPDIAKALAPALLEWARTHDPDEFMRVPSPAGPGTLLVTARPLAFDAECGTIAAGFLETDPPTEFQHLLLNVAATQATIAVQNVRLLKSLQQSILEKEQSQAGERRAREEIETLHEVSRRLVGELDLQRLVQGVTDAATQLSGAKFGAIFYNDVDAKGGTYSLYTLSGAPREAFEKFGSPRNTPLFDLTFRGTGILRLDNVQEDARYGKTAPHYGMPEGHLPVRSYLAVPIRSRSGEVFGGLFLGHPAPGVFTERAERLTTGIAALAAVAIDNARLYGQAQAEIAARRRHEEHQKMLLDELNHRVKNTLATVQSIVAQATRGADTGKDFQDSVESRLFALSNSHDLLTRENWEPVSLRDVAGLALTPFANKIGETRRFTLEGDDIRLRPKLALALGMAFHELATNAAKYGALSGNRGHVEVSWTITGDRLSVRWQELGGPPVTPPRRKGFGSRLVERGLARELGGEVRLVFAPEGVSCDIEMPAPPGKRT